MVPRPAEVPQLDVCFDLLFRGPPPLPLLHFPYREGAFKVGMENLVPKAVRPRAKRAKVKTGARWMGLGLALSHSRRTCIIRNGVPYSLKGHMLGVREVRFLCFHVQAAKQTIALTGTFTAFLRIAPETMCQLI